MNKKKSIGIDISLSNTGVIGIENGKAILNRSIKTKPPKEKTVLNELERLKEIRDEVMKSINNTDIVVIEGSSLQSRNTTSLVQLAGLNYMIREALHNLGNKFIIIPPTRLKKFISGKGNAPKELMLLATFKRFGVYFNDNNICDAYGLAMIGQYILGYEDDKTTQDQRNLIEKIKEEQYI